MEKEMSHVKTLANSSGPTEEQGIPDAAASQQLGQAFLKSVTEKAGQGVSTPTKHHELSIYSTMVG